MQIREATAQECEEFLDRVGFGRLACVRDNEPYVVPIYFAYEAKRLYGFSALGQKIDWMRANPGVCVEADEVFSNNSWTCVVARGRYEELPDAAEYASKRQQAHKLLEKRFQWWQPDWQPFRAAEQLHHGNHPFTTILYCVHVTNLTGRTAVPDGATWIP